MRSQLREMKCVCSLTEHRNKCEFASRVLTISEYFLLRAAEATFITLTSKERMSTNLRKVAQYPKNNPITGLVGAFKKGKALEGAFTKPYATSRRFVESSINEAAAGRLMWMPIWPLIIIFHCQPATSE